MCMLGSGHVYYSYLSSCWNCDRFELQSFFSFGLFCASSICLLFVCSSPFRNSLTAVIIVCIHNRLFGPSDVCLTSQERENMHDASQPVDFQWFSAALPQMSPQHVCWPMKPSPESNRWTHPSVLSVFMPLLPPVKLRRLKPRVIVILLSITALS